MNKKSLYLVLAILIFAIVIRHFQGCAIETNPSVDIDTIPKPGPQIIVSKPENLPIVYNDIDKAKDIAKHYSKKLILIFSAEWCVFCKKLKLDLEGFVNNSYTLCLINIDTNKTLIQKYNIKTLPTSIVLENDKEIKRSTGYNKSLYINWLKSL